MLIDAESVAVKLSKRTKAIVAVHLYGAMCGIEGLKALCGEHGVALVEDFSQAHGAAFPQGKAGSFGDVSVCSFYPTKPLGALGDGGAVLTNDEAVKKEMTALREYGWRVRNDSSLAGYNSRLDELQATVLHVKLNYLDEWNQERIERACETRKSLISLSSVNLPETVDGNIYHLFPVLVQDRCSVIRRLEAAGIGSGIHYPVPIHKQTLFREENEGTRLPISERICEEILSVPTLDPAKLLAAMS